MEPRYDPVASPPTDLPDAGDPWIPTDDPEPARGALRATPNQHSFDDLDDDEAADTDGARTYHGVDDPA